MDVDLKAYRCPNAQVLANAVLLRFVTSNASSLKLTSIEPSLERSLRHRIEHLGLSVYLSAVNTVEISPMERQKWSSEFDEEDYEDVLYKQAFTISKL